MITGFSLLVMQLDIFISPLPEIPTVRSLEFQEVLYCTIVAAGPCPAAHVVQGGGALLFRLAFSSACYTNKFDIVLYMWCI
jgi:hypothetical protein